MKNIKFHEGGLFLIMLALTALACGTGDIGLGGTETAVTIETPTNTAYIVEPFVETAETLEANDPQIELITKALLDLYDEDSAFLAVAAALERGYSFEQIEAGALTGRLEANGQITSEDNNLQQPIGQPAGVLDLSELEAKNSRVTKRWMVQAMPVKGREFLGMFKEINAVENQGTDAIGIYILLGLAKNGYSMEQIFLALASGDNLAPSSFITENYFETKDCIAFIDQNGRYIYPDGKNYFTNLCISTFEEEFGKAMAETEENTDTVETELEETELIDATLTIDDIQVERTECIHDQKGHTFDLNCFFDILISVSYEVPKTPAILYCEARSGGAMGAGETVLELTNPSGSELVIISGATVWGLYIDENENGAADPREGDQYSRENDGYFTGIKCGVSELPFESRVTFFLTAWQEASCPHPDTDEPATCFGPWLDLADAHAWD
jgi:hypothetical protein